MICVSMENKLPIPLAVLVADSFFVKQVCLIKGQLIVIARLVRAFRRCLFHPIN